MEFAILMKMRISELVHKIVIVATEYVVAHTTRTIVIAPEIVAAIQLSVAMEYVALAPVRTLQIALEIAEEQLLLQQ